MPTLEAQKPMPILNSDRYVYRCVVFKLANHCNLACDYCYRGSNVIHEEDIIPLETVEAVVASLIELNRKRGQGTAPLYLLWHGGEPLLAGMPYFQDLLRMEKRYREASGVQFANGIQTNATLIDEKWADFLTDCGFSVGVSLDGPKSVHDAHRRTKGGRSSYEMTMRGVSLLRNKGCPISAIAVINNDTAATADECYRFFAESGFSIIDFIPCFDYGQSMTLNSGKYLAFITGIAEKYLADPAPPFRIRLIDDIVLLLTRRVQNNTPLSCEVAGRCGEIFSVLTNGDVYPCECLNCLQETMIGNIHSATLHDMVAGDAYVRFMQQARNISRECLECDIFAVCRGGCFNRRIMQKDPAGSIDHFCDVRYELIRFIEKNIQARNGATP